MDWIGLAYAEGDAEANIAAYSDLATAQEKASVWAEAEEPTRLSHKEVDGVVVGKISTKERGEHLSSGITNGFHEDLESWVEYDVDVPVTGTYKVVFTYGTDRSGVLNPLLYNVGVAGQSAIIELTGTGGWGNEPEQIREVTVEKEFAVEAGPQTIKMQRLKDQINMDWIGLELVREQDITAPATSDNSMLLGLFGIMLLAAAFLTWRKFAIFK